MKPRVARLQSQSPLIVHPTRPPASSSTRLRTVAVSETQEYFQDTENVQSVSKAMRLDQGGVCKDTQFLISLSLCLLVGTVEGGSSEFCESRHVPFEHRVSRVDVRIGAQVNSCVSQLFLPVWSGFPARLTTCVPWFKSKQSRHVIHICALVCLFKKFTKNAFLFVHQTDTSSTIQNEDTKLPA